jgi:hypothetical protein
MAGLLCAQVNTSHRQRPTDQTAWALGNVLLEMCNFGEYRLYFRQLESSGVFKLKDPAYDLPWILVTMQLGRPWVI